VARHQFPGFPVFLEAAARQIGHPEAAGPARRIEALSAFANLCAQAARADGAHVKGILAKAREFRDQLHAAHRAADLMLDDLGYERGAAVPSLAPDPPGPPAESNRRVGGRAISLSS